MKIDPSVAMLKAENDRLRAALERIAALKVTGPSPIGPLMGAGIAHGFDVAAAIAREALAGGLA